MNVARYDDVIDFQTSKLPFVYCYFCASIDPRASGHQRHLRAPDPAESHQRVDHVADWLPFM